MRNKLREVFGGERLSAKDENNPPHLITGLTVMWNWQETDLVATWNYPDSSKTVTKDRNSKHPSSANYDLLYIRVTD